MVIHSDGSITAIGYSNDPYVMYCTKVDHMGLQTSIVTGLVTYWYISNFQHVVVRVKEDGKEGNWMKPCGSSTPSWEFCVISRASQSYEMWLSEIHR